MLNNKNFTNINVKYLREKKGISQTKLSKDLNIDPSTLAKWENNTRQITLEWAIKLANYFDIKVGDFIAVNQITKDSSLPTTDDEFKKILKNKGLINDNDDITEDDVKKLLDFAIANKQFVLNKKDEKD